VLHHAAIVALWGVLFALVAARVRGLRLLAAAALFGAAAYVVDPRVLPDLLRFGHAIAARTSQFVVLCALLSLGLAAGMRLARGSTRLT
jgi:hypothetical protein